MKRVLIVGANSYIGKSFAGYAKDQFDITTVDTMNGEWKTVSFAGYDSIFHVAGIAHVKTTKANEQLYYDINCNLALDVATKAKAEGVKQFVFLSSIYVYINGLQTSQIISKSTLPNPGTVYGKSKHMAEQELQKLASDSFKLCFVRPPMVYGPGCKGNFPSLVKLARLTPVFPCFPNKRSMIYIDNLCEHLNNLISDNYEGITMPHNSEYVNTTDLVKTIRNILGKRTHSIKIFNMFIVFLSKRVSVVNKLFGDLCYAMQGNEYTYNITGFDESVSRSVPMA